MTDEFIPTPSLWRPTGDVETHVPTMSAAEQLWRRRNQEAYSMIDAYNAAEQVAAKVTATAAASVTDFERHLLGYFRHYERLTLARLMLLMAQGNDILHGEDPASVISSLHARGYLKRNPGRGGPYSLTDAGTACGL